MPLDVVILRPDRPRLGPFALRAEGDLALDRLERVAVHVFGELVVVERLGCGDRLFENLQFAVGEGRQEIAKQIDPLGRRPGLVLLDEVHDAGKLHRRDRLPQVDVGDAVGRLAELHLDRRCLQPGEAAAEHLGAQPDLADRTHHLGLGRLHRANDRREIDRGRRIGAVVDDIDAGPLRVLARALGGLMLELGVGGDDGDRLRLRLLRRCQIEIALGEGLHRLGAERQHREVFRIVELVVRPERKQSEKQPVVRDRDRYCRGYQIGAVARNQQIDFVDVDQLGVDPRDVRGIALVVVIDQLDRPAEQPALGVDLLLPDLEGEQPCLADDGERAGQFHAEADRDRLLGAGRCRSP